MAIQKSGALERIAAFTALLTPAFATSLEWLGHFGTACTFVSSVRPGLCEMNSVVELFANPPTWLALAMFAVGLFLWGLGERKRTIAIAEGEVATARKIYAEVEGRVAGMESSLEQSVLRVDNDIRALGTRIENFGQLIERKDEEIAEVRGAANAGQHFAKSFNDYGGVGRAMNLRIAHLEKEGLGILQGRVAKIEEEMKAAKDGIK